MLRPGSQLTSSVETPQKFTSLLVGISSEPSRPPRGFGDLVLGTSSGLEWSRLAFTLGVQSAHYEVSQRRRFGDFWRAIGSLAVDSGVRFANLETSFGAHRVAS